MNAPPKHKLDIPRLLERILKSAHVSLGERGLGDYRMTQREALHLIIDQLSDAESEVWFMVHPDSHKPTDEKCVDWIYQAKQRQSQQRAKYGYGELPCSVRVIDR